MIEKFITLVRRYNDEFFFQTMIDILTQFELANLNYRCGYVPWVELANFKPFRGNDNLVIFHLDFLTDLDDLHAIASSNINRKIVYFSSQLAPQHLKKFSNVHVINWGSDCLLQEQEYRTLDPVTKIFDSSPRHWISLNHTPRTHRLALAVYLNGLGLSQFGNIHINPESMATHANWQSAFSPKFDTLSLELNDAMTRGFYLLKNSQNTTDKTSLIYPLRNNDNVSNFNKNLREHYKNTVVEIVNETCFTEPGTHLTEKFINSVFGMNIPLLIGTPGIVNYVKELGFDMFDDIVDTKYDSISDPLQRLACAVDSNVRLLSDAQFAKDAWQKCQTRLIKNVLWAKYCMHDRARQQTLNSVPKAIEFLSS